MNKHPLVRVTKIILDFMFYTGIVVCASVPFLFKFVGEYYSIFKTYYVPFSVIFVIAGIFAILILWELRSMFRTVIKGDPFVRQNVNSLKRMGTYSFTISISMAIRLFFIVTPAEMVLVMVFLIAGLFSLVLSLVFDQAVIYKEENDLTI